MLITISPDTRYYLCGEGKDQLKAIHLNSFVCLVWILES